METQSSSTASLQVRRTFQAPREKVFKAWTDPEALKSWFVHPGYETTDASVDPREGGRYRITVRELPDGEPYSVVGTYKEIRPPERLVFTWSWDNAPETGETLVTVQFRDLGASTEIILTHDLFETEEQRSRHEAGWGLVLEGLERHFA